MNLRPIAMRNLLLTETSLFALSDAMALFGAVRGREHLRHFLGAPGRDGDVPRSEIHYGNYSDIADKVRAHTNAQVPFKRVDEKVKASVEKRLEALARTEQYDKRAFLDPSVEELDFYLYVPIPLSGTSVNFVTPVPPKAIELQVSFGGMQEASALVNEIEFIPNGDARCGVRTVPL